MKRLMISFDISASVDLEIEPCRQTEVFVRGPCIARPKAQTLNQDETLPIVVRRSTSTPGGRLILGPGYYSFE